MDIDNIKIASQVLNNISQSGIINATYNKLQLIKVNKDENERIHKYEEIINSLISENQQLLSIAQMFKSEYERINISDEDIEHLQNTVRRVIYLLMDTGEEENEELKNIENLISLIEKDTLKTAQLLGFNYKKAIGEPATELVASLISNSVNITK